ncbi:hemerythrin domain-containing protein [Sphingomonas japonica]|uniref:Iron-sulfur cluster repair protein YtfE (RIC family) n=1 Tax=Sphingomonas japonica TaxID=511662 RepID=A0ABX0TZ55_9SPHN|nr:hemerythrin domain-containing protein [Sphingomonas japonica]NIJ23595.1 iron-sulfur cluster repair protein YtfE (RIC family) [Sphingomonas japonica]
MHSFERLIAEHQAILEHAKQLSGICAAPADPAAAHRALTALGADLAEHLATEDRDIYPRLMLSNDEGAADAARRAIRQFETLAADWTVHQARWTQCAIRADWETFVADNAELLDRLAQRIRTENDLLYPLALRAAHIRLRA